MALNLLYTPGDYFSAHGDLIFTILEDTKPFASSTYPDYKYVCDIYISGVMVARLKAFPRPDDKIGVFNIGNVVRNYLNATFLPQDTDIFYQKLGSGAFYIPVICRFGEEYGFVTYTNMIIDSQRTYFNHYNGRLFGTDTILPDVIDKVMSSRPYATSVSRSATHYLIPFLASDDTVVTVEVRCYNKSLGFIRQQNFTITPTALSVNEVLQINIAPECLNFAFPSLIDSIVDYYTVTWNTTNIVDDSVYRFDLACDPKYETYGLHFMNKYGAFESKEFGKVSRRKIEVEKKDYGTSAYIINADGIPKYLDQKVYRETRSVYAGSWKEKMTLNTDLLPDAEYVWLEDLIKSPLAYIQIQGYFYPIVITDTNYEPKKTINDDLTNLTINIEFGDRFNTQYR
jgi:hypothetical protein